MKTKTSLIIGLIILLIGLGSGIGIGYSIWKPKPIPIVIPNYVPQIVEIDKWKEKPVPYIVQLPPHITYKYMSFEDSMKLVKVTDSLLFLVNKTKPGDTVYIKSQFLSTFPTSPKLVNIDLQMDSIDITLFSINADLFTKRYPLTLFTNKYRFDGTNISVKPLDRPWGVPKTSKWRFGLIGFVGSNLINYPDYKIYVSTQGYASWKRLHMQVEPLVTIEEHPALGLNAKLGIGIWEWPKR